MLEFIKKDKKLILFSVFVGFVASVFAGAFFSKAYADKVQGELAENVIRFHVVANSDSTNDQELKLIVRDEVIAFLEDKLENCEDKEESRKVIEDNLAEIEAVAEETAFKNGFPYEIKAEFLVDTFPLRQYGDIRMPAGNYDALKISIGKAEGRNWWCVVYPPLCFLDIASDCVTEESEKRLLSVADDIMVASDDVVPEFKFKIVEFWKELEHKNDSYAVKP